MEENRFLSGKVKGGTSRNTKPGSELQQIADRLEDWYGHPDRRGREER